MSRERKIKVDLNLQPALFDVDGRGNFIVLKREEEPEPQKLEENHEEDNHKSVEVDPEAIVETASWHGIPQKPVLEGSQRGAPND